MKICIFILYFGKYQHWHVFGNTHTTVLPTTSNSNNLSLILCYPSKLGTIKGLTNLSEINVVTNRTAQLQLEHVPRDLYQICNRKDLWPTWSRWKKHGIRLSSDGKTVTIETSYALGKWVRSSQFEMGWFIVLEDLRYYKC